MYMTALGRDVVLDVERIWAVVSADLGPPRTSVVLGSDTQRHLVGSAARHRKSLFLEEHHLKKLVFTCHIHYHVYDNKQSESD